MRWTNLIELRTTGDYGGIEHVTLAEAKEAVDMAKKILNAEKKCVRNSILRVSDPWLKQKHGSQAR